MTVRCQAIDLNKIVVSVALDGFRAAVFSTVSIRNEFGLVQVPGVLRGSVNIWIDSDEGVAGVNSKRHRVVCADAKVSIPQSVIVLS